MCAPPRDISVSRSGADPQTGRLTRYESVFLGPAMVRLALHARHALRSWCCLPLIRAGAVTVEELDQMRTELAGPRGAEVIRSGDDSQFEIVHSVRHTLSLSA